MVIATSSILERSSASPGIRGGNVASSPLISLLGEVGTQWAGTHNV